MAELRVRKGMPSVHLDKQQFRRVYFERFSDPAFASLQPQIEQLMETAWEAYEADRKSPRTAKAGPEFHNPAYDLAIEWLETRKQIMAAEKRQKDPNSPSRILLVNGSSRSDQTCPGEISKSWRLMEMARALVKAEAGFEDEVIDLS
ncbi:MAG: NADPH-dependent FMN reductase, partial [Aestuariivirgaceae bacterium]